MASIYESQGQQVALGGPSVSPGFNPVRVYDPSQQMLQAVEQQAQLKNRELEQLTAFSTTLNKTLQDQGEQWKKGQIAKGFSKFISGQKGSISPAYQQEHKDAELRLVTDARRDNQLATAAEVLPGAEGVAAGIRTNSPALKGWEAYGYSIGQAQNAPFSLANYINKARAENAIIRDPEAGIDIALTPRMGRSQAERAMELLTEKWAIESGISKINPQVLMENAGQNLAIAKVRLMEDWGKELDSNSKAMQQDIAFTSGVKILSGITDVGTASSAAQGLEKALAAYSYQEINEQFPKILDAAYQAKVAAGDSAGATALLTNLGNTPHPSGVGTFRERFLTTFQSLEGKLQEFGANQEKARRSEQLALFQQEAERYDGLPVAQRDERLNNPTTGLITRMRLAGMAEEDINKARTGGSNPFEIALLKGIRDGDLLKGANRITKGILDTYLATGRIDKSVYDQVAATPELAQQQTVNDVFKNAKDQAMGLIRAWQTQSYTGSAVPSEASKAQAGVVAQVAVVKAMSKLQASIQTQVDNNQKINIVQVSQDLASLARAELNDTNSTYYWNTTSHSAPNINKATNKLPNTTAQPTFITTVPKDVMAAVTSRVSAKSSPVLDPTAVDIPPEMIANEQLAVSQGGKISTSVRNIAAASGYQDVNRYLSDQASKNGITWKPNPDQQQFLANARAISPAKAARLAGELLPSERRLLTQQLETLRIQQQTKASLQATPVGGAYSTFQNDLISREGGGSNPYGQYNFGFARSGPADPNIPNLKVRDVVSGTYRINGQQVIHFGAYQFKAATFAAVAKKAGISMDAPFNKDTQDRAFQAVVMEGALPWRNSLNDYMSRKVPDNTQTRAAAIQDLRSEWTSMENLTPSKLGTYLQQMRMEKQQLDTKLNLSNLPGNQKAVKTGQVLLSMGVKPWQHPNFDINKGYVEKGGTVGGHDTKSYHYANSALDVPLSHNSVTSLDNAYEYLKTNAAALGVTELFWDRKGYYQNGTMIGGPRSNTISGHDTHLHVAFE